MMLPTLNANQQLIIDTVLEAGKHIQNLYSQNIGHELKQDNSPVTQADIEANKILCDGLAVLNIPIVTEESETSHGINTSALKQWILIDPLDGTKEFINKTDEFTVNVALVENGIVQFGAIYCPPYNTLYVGGTTVSSYKVVGNGQAELLNANAQAEKYRVAVSRSYPDEETIQYAKSIASEKELAYVKAGSSLKFCLLADGKIDVYPRLTGLMEWDVAAGHAIVKGANKNMYAVKTMQEVTYGNANLRVPPFVAK